MQKIRSKSKEMKRMKNLVDGRCVFCWEYECGNFCETQEFMEHFGLYDGPMPYEKVASVEVEEDEEGVEIPW